MKTIIGKAVKKIVAMINELVTVVTKRILAGANVPETMIAIDVRLGPRVLSVQEDRKVLWDQEVSPVLRGLPVVCSTVRIFMH